MKQSTIHFKDGSAVTIGLDNRYDDKSLEYALKHSEDEPYFSVTCDWTGKEIIVWKENINYIEE